MNRLRALATAVGMGLALIGVIQNDRRLIWAAIAAIIISLLLRITSRARPGDPPAR